MASMLYRLTEWELNPRKILGPTTLAKWGATDKEAQYLVASLVSVEIACFILGKPVFTYFLDHLEE